MRRHLAILALSLAAASGVACSLATDDSAGSQESAHTEGQITFAQYKWLWADETLDEFKANAASGSFWDTPEFLPLDHPMTARLQFWLDTMDRAVREAFPKELENTPPPKLIVRKTTDPNAWVTYMPISFDVKGRLARASAVSDASAPPPPDPDAGDAAPPPPPAPPPVAPLFFLYNTGKVGTLQSGTAIKRPFDKTLLDQFVKFHDDGFSKCNLKTDGTEIYFNEGCVVDDSLSPSLSSSVAFYGTAKYVTITTGLITSMLDEDRIVAVLAHELGHYYRTHSAQPSDMLNYFYALGDANEARKPAPAPQYMDKTLAVRDKLRSSSWFMDFSEENKFMAEKHVGFYTTEQEADEISLEILTRMGLPPTLGPDSQLQLQKIVDDLNGPNGGNTDTGEIKWSQCSVLRDKQFKDDTGAEVSVPVGDLSDPHHSFCFRTFNMERELRAHKYNPVGNRPVPPGDAWSRIVTRLAAELDPPPPPAPPPAATDAGPDAPSDAGTD